MHSICRRRKAFSLRADKHVSNIGNDPPTGPQPPTSQIGIRPWLCADALNLQRAATGAVRSCKELLLRYAEDSSNGTPHPRCSQLCVKTSESVSVGRDDAYPRCLRPIWTRFFCFLFFFLDVSHFSSSVECEMYYRRQIDENPWWEST